MTEARKIYIKSATQISMQQPLSEEWLTAPLVQTETYVRSQDPNFREWLNPLESRRMGKIMKRAIVTATAAMKEADSRHPTPSSQEQDWDVSRIRNSSWSNSAGKERRC